MDYLKSAKRQFNYYKSLAEKTFAQLSDDQLQQRPNEESNSIVVIVKHLRGNMLSRWTDFLTTDGEKDWRDRDSEFEEGKLDRDQFMQLWEEGWNCLNRTLDSLHENDLKRMITIRGEEHTVLEAINRQLAHYPYHVGQIVYIGKWLVNTHWRTLSIPRKGSKAFNDKMPGKKP